MNLRFPALVNVFLFMSFCTGSDGTLVIGEKSGSNPVGVGGSGTTAVAPSLNNLSISVYDQTSVTLAKPVFTVPGADPKTIRAYLGLSTSINSNGSAIANYLQGPIDVSNAGYTFSSLISSTSYKIFVVAQNVHGYSIKSIIQTTESPCPGDGNETPACATTILPATPVNSTISQDTDVDYYKIAISDTMGTYTILTYDGGTSICSLDTTLILYGTDGTTVLSSNDNASTISGPVPDPCSTINGVFSANGTYYVRVASSAIGSPRTGPYTLRVTFTPNEKKIFITSTQYNGNLGGVSGADSKCQARASAAGLSGTYKAIISSNTSNAKERMPNSRYVTVTGEILSTNLAGLFDGGINYQIRTESGNYATTSGYAQSVWTGSDGNGNGYLSGSPTLTTCSNWSSSNSSYWGETGYVAEYYNSTWIQTGGTGWAPCDINRSLYCFQE